MSKFDKLHVLFIKFIAALHLLVILNPALVHANILEENVLYILSDKEQIDYNNKKLQEILHGEYSNKYLIFKVYKAFIEWDSSNKSNNDIKTAKEILNQLDSSYSEYISAFCKKDPEDAAEYIQNRFFCYLGSKRLLADTEEEFDRYNKLYNQFPLWLVLKYPQVLEYDHGRNPIWVAATNRFTDSHEFEAMWSVLHRMTDGNWVTTSYYPWRGTIHRDVYAGYHIVNRSVNFAPANILEYSDSESHNLLPARAWSSQGIWENLLYKKLLKTYKMALPKLEQYYLNNYGFDKYSKDSPKILSYIVNAFVFDQDITKSVAFQIIYQADEDFNKLKTLCNNTEMEKKDWNELFGRAIIENFEADALKWILDSGADINSKSFDETPLMKAVNKREILKFLLDHGADTEISNTFGKTPIFYAIQFGGRSEVKILVDAGANINKPLYNIEQVQENTMVEQVVDFTPLVYAMRYADKYLIDYLQNQGATLGNAPIERILLWVREGKLDL